MERKTGYRMMRGRKGAQGYIYGEREGVAAARGLPPGEECRLYQAEEGQIRPCASARTDGRGTARLPFLGGGALFLAVGKDVLLWEDGPDQARRYLNAQSWLSNQAAREEADLRRTEQGTEEREKQEQGTEERETEKAEPPLIPRPLGKITEAAAPYPESPEPDGKEAADSQKAAEEENMAAREEETEEPERRDTPAPPPQERETERGREPSALPLEEAAEGQMIREAQEIAREETWILRPESGEEAADRLPALIWPEEAAELRHYFESCVPFAPFDAPGWRFVRVPSPLRGVPFCAVGYRAQDCRVIQVAYAVPGTSWQAPAALPGYRYQIGREGQGYWTLWRPLRPALSD